MAKELTGQEVISELVTRLRTRFTTNQFKEVYKDKPVQGMVLPCIFVEVSEYGFYSADWKICDVGPLPLMSGVILLR